MLRLQVYDFSLLKYLFVLTLIFPLFSCSQEGEEDGGAVVYDESIINLGGFPTSTSLNWTAPTKRTDGSTVLGLGEISGYQINYGAKAGVYTSAVYKNGSNPEVTIQGIPPGTYNIVIVTIDTAGRESRYSSEFIVTVEMVS